MLKLLLKNISNKEKIKEKNNKKNNKKINETNNKKINEIKINEIKINETKINETKINETKINIILSDYSYASNLGHELGSTRIILLDLLSKGFIKSDNVNIYTMKDRIFLYSKIFKYVYDYKTLSNNNKNILSLTNYLGSNLQETTYELKELGYDYMSSIYRTSKFLEYVTNIEYYDIKVSKKFIIIHVRNNGNINNLDDMIKIILNKTLLNIIIFSMSSELKYEPNERIILVSELKLYASYLNNENCELIISEWSGGGQLSQYCSNSKIIYYYYTYPPDYINIYEKLLQEINDDDSIIYQYNYDFRKFTSLQIIHIKNIIDLLKHLENLF